MDRDGLAHFLRRRRAALAPEDVGLRHGRRRRTDGLRREEVAALASMSTDFYTRLEQRRGARPSPQVAAAIAAALRLTGDERDHLFNLLGHATPPHVDGDAGDLAELAPDAGLVAILDRLETPAKVVTATGVTLAQNALAVELLGVETGLVGLQASLIYRWFTAPDTVRGRFPARDHDRHSASYVAHLRALSGRHGEDAEVRALVAALTAESPEFAALWERHDVQPRSRMRKDVVHPELGVLAMDCHVLRSEDERQMLLVFTPAD